VGTDIGGWLEARTGEDAWDGVVRLGRLHGSRHYDDVSAAGARLVVWLGP
jgi:hypothetical protein